MSARVGVASRRDATPDSHLFPTRPYDLVKEFVIALVVIGAADRGARGGLLLPGPQGDHPGGLGAGRPGRRRRDGHRRAGRDQHQRQLRRRRTTTPATGRSSARCRCRSWGGVRIPVDSASDLVITPLRSVTGDAAADRARCRPGRRPTPTSRPSGPAPTPTRSPPPRTATRPRSSPATTVRCPCWPSGSSPWPPAAAWKVC